MPGGQGHGDGRRRETDRREAPGARAKQTRGLSPKTVDCRQSTSLTRVAKKGKKRKAAPGDIATNRQASYRYDLLERWESGIQLQGSEVKSMREGRVQLKDAYATVRDGVFAHMNQVGPEIGLLVQLRHV